MPSPNNLPLQLTSFIGREREIAEVKRLLSTSRLLTLTGPGGSGKTRLALQAASQLLEEYPDGVFFVNLAPITDPNLVVSTIAHTLHVTEAAGEPLIDTLKTYLSDKNILILLDNFEQVLQAATLVVDLLLSTLFLKVMVTSRERLHLQGEQQYQIPPLELPDPKQSLSAQQLSAYEAIALFVQRAQAVISQFTLTEVSARTVAQICIRLDGLPLAIELAAARLGHLPPKALLERLDNKLGSRLKLLTGGARNVPTRQQTLRNTIDWSYDLLSVEEKWLFRRLAVFAGGCTLETAEVLCGPHNDNSPGSLQPRTINLLDGLAALVDKSLLRQEPGIDGDTRFVMPEAIQEYARERLQESGEAEDAQQEYALVFLRMAEEAEEELQGSRSSALLGKLEIEHDNLRAALLWSCRAGNHDHVALRLAAALSRFWSVSGYYTEGREWLKRVLAETAVASTAPDDHAVVAARAKALAGAASLTYHQDDYTSARQLAEESLSAYSNLADEQGIALSLKILGNIAYAQGDYAGARPYYEKGLSIGRELGHERIIAQSLSLLGAALNAAGDYKAASPFLEESLEVYTSLDARGGVAFSLLCLGEAMRGVGNLDEATSLYEKSLEMSRDLGDKHTVSVALHNLGHMAVRRGDLPGAQAFFTESLALAKDLGVKTVIAWCLAAIGGVAGLMGEPVRAAHLFGAAEALLEVVNSRLESTDQTEYERNIAVARAQLRESAWQEAWQNGRALVLSGEDGEDIEQVVAYALQEAREEEPRVPPAPVAAYPNDLSRREVELLRLLAEGLTNEQIAQRLFLSPNTVRSHLYSIYNKLGVGNRGAAARFAVEHGLIQ